MNVSTGPALLKVPLMIVSFNPLYIYIYTHIYTHTYIYISTIPKKGRKKLQPLLLKVLVLTYRPLSYKHVMLKLMFCYCFLKYVKMRENRKALY